MAVCRNNFFGGSELLLPRKTKIRFLNFLLSISPENKYNSLTSEKEHWAAAFSPSFLVTASFSHIGDESGEKLLYTAALFRAAGKSLFIEPTSLLNR